MRRLAALHQTPATEVPHEEAAMTETIRDDVTAAPAPPYSALIRKAAGVCLVLAGLSNGLSQYVDYLVAGQGEWADQLRWGAENMAFSRVNAVVLILSALFMPLGLLGLAQVTRWSAPRLTLIGTPLMLWGMWGFHNILAGGYIVGPASTTAFGAEGSVKLSESMTSDPVGLLIAVGPHAVGSFLGLILLTIAAWRSGAFPKAACALFLAFLVWDFFLEPFGRFFEAHLLLFVAWTWLGIALLRMPQAVWSGAEARSGRAGRFTDRVDAAAAY